MRGFSTGNGTGAVDGTGAPARPPGRFRLKEDDISWLPVEEQILVLDLRTSRYVSLNESAAALWAALAGGGTADELVDVLRTRYDIDVALAQRDVTAFLDGLRERDLLDEAR